MKNKLSLLIGIIVLVVLLAYMFTFQVRYDEVAVRSTFGSVVEPTYDESGNMIDTGSLYFEPGLQWKLPWPIHQVQRLPRKLHMLVDHGQQIQTADSHTIVVRTHLTWRIADPHQFFQQFGQDRAGAEDQLRRMMSNISGVISSYRFDELVNSDPEQLRLDEVEQACLEHLRQDLASADPGYGIEIVSFGIRRILLPQSVSEDVFARMRATRERMAEDILARGRSEAASIRNEAESTKQIILDFANRRAEQIRAEGDTEAARYYEAFADHQELAIFLREIEALQQMLAHNTTFILDANQLSVLQPFVNEPGSEAETVDADAEDVDVSAEVRAAMEAARESREISPEQWEAFQQWQASQSASDAATAATSEAAASSSASDAGADQTVTQ